MLLDETTIYMIMIGIYSLGIAYFIIRWYRNRSKLLVRIKYPKEKRLLVTPEGDYVTLGEKQSLGRGKGFAPAWTVNFSMACLYFTGWFNNRLTLDVMPDAKEAIPYFKPLTEDKIPKWTKKEHEDYATLTGLKALQQLGEQKTSMVLWIIVALQIIGLILPFVMGRIRF